mmetsp:Transcript_21229/g.70105  ORF Transcript_21229/g.70105 Transcript_21229/m.70105 type:complete len:247 (+) Transcript_21229:271-1011(+)
MPGTRQPACSPETSRGVRHQIRRRRRVCHREGRHRGGDHRGGRLQVRRRRGVVRYGGTRARSGGKPAVGGGPRECSPGGPCGGGRGGVLLGGDRAAADSAAGAVEASETAVLSEAAEACEQLDPAAAPAPSEESERSDATVGSVSQLLAESADESRKPVAAGGGEERPSRRAAADASGSEHSATTSPSEIAQAVRLSADQRTPPPTGSPASKRDTSDSPSAKVYSPSPYGSSSRTGPMYTSPLAVE